MSEDSLFAKIKYELVDIEDDNTWKICETYPDEVKTAWAWRVATDVEHFAKGHKLEEHCIEMAKQFKDGLVPRQKLLDAQSAVNNKHVGTDKSLINSAMAAYAYFYAVDTPFWAIQGVYYASIASNKEKEYTDWLLEELGNHDNSI